METLGLTQYNQLAEFFKGRRIFLTGHTGFKGSWLSLLLTSMGAQVSGYALEPPTDPSLFKLAGVEGLIRSITGDIRDYEFLRQSLENESPEVVIHMAAQALVRDSYQYPRETFEVNVMGTVNVLDAARRIPSVKAILIITSDKCYENREWLWGYRENEPMGGYDPYSGSKGCAELVTSAYRSSFFLHSADRTNEIVVASARAGNVIGGGDWAKDRLIPDILSSLASNKPAMIRNPRAVRPWQHVLEPLTGYLMLVERMVSEGAAFGEPWNFGPDEKDCKSVEWVVQQLCELWDEKAGWIADTSVQPHEAVMLKLDCSKAKSKLGWSPRSDLMQALGFIIEWHKAYKRGDDMAAVCFQQIKQFYQL